MIKPKTLDSILSAFSVDIEAFAICEIAEHTRLVFPPIDAIEVHHVLEGTLYLSIEGETPLTVEAGGMLIVPPGTLQYVAGGPDATTDLSSADVCLPVREGMVFLDATEDAKCRLRIACGTVRADISGSFGPLDGLARPIAEAMSDVPIVSAAFEAMLQEAATPSEGTRALTSALMKACLIILLRRHFQTARADAVPPALLQHARLGKAIAAVLDRPATDHSVASLAAVAGMSRSAFARDFKAIIGATPMEFVMQTRLSHARSLLQSTGHPVGMVASITGFPSRTHFSRAFRDAYGVDPSAFRRDRKENGVGGPA